MPLTQDEIAFLANVRRWVERDVTPHVAEWDEAGTFPRELYKKAAEVGVLAVGFPESVGGVGGSARLRVALQREICRAETIEIREGSTTEGGKRDRCHEVLTICDAKEVCAWSGFHDPSTDVRTANCSSGLMSMIDAVSR